MNVRDLKLGDTVRYRDKSTILTVSNLGSKGFETVNGNGVVYGSDDASEYTKIMKKEIKDPTVSEFIGQALCYGEDGYSQVWSRTATGDHRILADLVEYEHLSKNFHKDFAQFIVDAINEKITRINQPTENKSLRQIEMVTDKATIYLIEKPKGVRMPKN